MKEEKIELKGKTKKLIKTNIDNINKDIDDSLKNNEIIINEEQNIDNPEIEEIKLGVKEKLNNKNKKKILNEKEPSEEIIIDEKKDEEINKKEIIILNDEKDNQNDDEKEKSKRGRCICNII